MAQAEAEAIVQAEEDHLEVVVFLVRVGVGKAAGRSATVTQRNGRGI
jgi:hypothetical protein